MRTEITYGYLGPVKIYSLCRVLRVMRVRTPKRNEFHLILGKNRTFPLFVFPLSAKYRCADRQNREALRTHEEVFARIDRARGEGKKVVLYVLDYLIEAGGVERRFELQFDWLEKHGVQPVLVCGRQEYAPLAHVPTILFNERGALSTDFLIEVIRRTQAAVVEFQMKCPRLLHAVDLGRLNKAARTGCMIHGKLRAKAEVLGALNYRATSRVHHKLCEDVTDIPNVVGFSASYPTYDANAAKALYVGRIDQDKLPTVRNFVAICTRYGFGFEIAGPISRGQKQVNAFISELPQEALLGTIDTRAFLQKQGGAYAFVGGVGQVPLEAAAANLPALVTPHLPDPGRAVFLTQENFAKLHEWNCVITEGNIPEELAPGNVEMFMQALKIARETSSTDAIEPFRVRRVAQKLISEDVVWSSYRELLFPDKESGTAG